MPLIVLMFGGFPMRLAAKIPQGKVFTSFFGSYIIMLLIPFIIGIAAYKEVVANVEQNANEKNLMSLNQCMSVLDRRFDEIETFAAQLASNPNVITFAREKNPYVDRTVPTKINDLRKEIAPYTSTSNFISDIDLYFNNSDVMIGSVMPHLMLDRFYGDFFTYGNLTKDQWSAEIIKKKHYKQFFPEQDVMLCDNYASKNFTTQKMMMYMQSFPFTSMDKGFVMILIANSKIREMLTDVVNNEGGWAYIADPDNRVMASFSAPDLSLLPLKFDENGGTNGFSRQEVLGQDVSVTYTTSPKNGWKYVAVIPQATVMARTQHIKKFIALVFGIALLAGMIGALLLAYWNSRPIRHIVATIRSFLGGVDKQCPGNEYSFLNSSILDLGANNQSLNERLKRQQPLLKATFVERLLVGGLSRSEEIRWMIEQLGFNPLEGQIAVAIAKLTRPFGGEAYALNAASVVKLMVVDHVREHTGSDVYYHDLDFDKRAIVFGLGTGRTDEKEYVDSVLNAVSMELLQNHDVTVMFTVGSFSCDYLGVEKAFEEAREALDYKTLHVDRKVVWYSDIPQGSSSYYYPINVETHIVNYAKLGDYKEIERLLNRVQKENFVKRNLSPAMSKLLAYDIGGTLIKVLDIMTVEHPEEVCRVREAVFPAIDRSQSVEEMFEQVRSMYKEICDHFSGFKKSRGNIGKILEYVKDNYADSQLCLTSLAHKFDFSPTYLSQYIKDSTGENFSALLENIRIEKACELLKNGVPVSEVAETVGYNSVYVFRSAFKRMIGKPPSKLNDEEVS